MGFRKATLLVALAGVILAGQACSKTSSHSPRPAAAVSSPAPTAESSARAAPIATATGTAGGSSTPNPTGTGYIVADPKFEPLTGARALYGSLGGAAYEIEVPANWNGDLVLYAHGFVGNDPILFVQTPPLRSFFVQHGFAWAASSYASSGYNPDQGVRDTIALQEQFIRDVGTPARTYIDGTSMGGHVVVSMMEQHPELVSGGFSECGVVGGVEESDYLASYVALGAFFASAPLLPIPDAAAYRDTVRSRVLPALGPPSAPTSVGAAFESVIKSLTGGARPWRHQGFVDRRTPNFDLAVTDDPRNPSLATRAGTNTGIQYHVEPGLGYDDGQLNAFVIRIPADPQARNADAHPDYAPRTGRLTAPLLTLHTTGDHFVPISQEQNYRRLVDAAGAGDLLVQRAIRRPGHCQFSPQELTRGFTDLVAWVEQGTVPEGDDLRNPDLRDAGRRFTQPLLPGDPGDE